MRFLSVATKCSDEKKPNLLVVKHLANLSSAHHDPSRRHEETILMFWIPDYLLYFDVNAADSETTSMTTSKPEVHGVGRRLAQSDVAFWYLIFAAANEPYQFSIKETNSFLHNMQ